MPTVRLTVPIFHADFEIEARHEVNGLVTIARLNDEEAIRIARSWGEEGNPPQVRMEICPFVVPEDWRAAEKMAMEAVRRAFSLLALSYRDAPLWRSILMDERREVWTRREWAWTWGGGIGSPTWIGKVPRERLRTWGRLLDNWPLLGFDDRLNLALDYYYDSVIDRGIHPNKAMVSAAIAMEALLGERTTTELRYRLAQRGALLTADGENAIRLAQLLGDWYVVRSKLLHSRIRAPQDVVTKLQQFLMRAIPSLAHLRNLAGSYAAAIDILDAAPFQRSPLLQELFASGGWWSFVDVPLTVDTL